MVAHKTAITRKVPSAPTKWLASRGKIIGAVLDYGCGKGFDALAYGMDSYDPHYQPIKPRGPFDTIICNYVLNIIESPEERARVLLTIRNLLAPGGCAYITVRNDKKALNGTTRIGTWQGMIKLDLPVEHKCAGYVIYRLE